MKNLIKLTLVTTASAYIGKCMQEGGTQWWCGVCLDSVDPNTGYCDKNRWNDSDKKWMDCTKCTVGQHYDDCDTINCNKPISELCQMPDIWELKDVDETVGPWTRLHNPTTPETFTYDIWDVKTIDNTSNWLIMGTWHCNLF